MIWGMLLKYKQILYPLSEQPTNWKIIISQRFSHRRKSYEPHIRLSSLGPGIRRRCPQSIWLWRPAGLKSRSSTGLWETKVPLSRGTHKVSRALGHRATQLLHWNVGQTQLQVLENLLGKWGSLWLTVGASTLIAKPQGPIITVSIPRVTIFALANSL